MLESSFFLHVHGKGRLGSTLSFMQSYIHSHGKYSRTLLEIGVNDISLKSDWMLLGG